MQMYGAFSLLNDKMLEQESIWSGSYIMTPGHTAKFSKNISSLRDGIILIFSKYTEGTVRNYSFQTFYIPKYTRELLPVKSGFQFPLYDGKTLCFKYLYIYDDRIEGHDDNGNAPNNTYVLRYVIGQ